MSGYRRVGTGGGLTAEQATRLSNAVQRPDVVINVKDFGAKGDDVADDTAAVQAAFEAAGTFVTGPANVGKGAEVFFPKGTFRCNIVNNYTGVTGTGQGMSTVLRPAAAGPQFIAPQGNYHWGGLRNMFLRGNGATSTVTPYAAGGLLGKTYRLLLTNGLALTAGTTYTSVTVAAAPTAWTIPAGATLTISDGGVTPQIVRVTTATTLSTTAATAIPVASFAAAAAYDTTVRVAVTGGFNHGIYLPRGRGSAAAGTTSGTWACSWDNLRIENYGNNGIHIEGGTIRQAQQLSRWTNIQAEYNHESGVYMDGFVQNNVFDFRLRNNRFHNMVHQSWLANHITGEAWQATNHNTFGAGGIYEVAGSYVDATGALVAGTTTAHGIYTQGYENTYEGCYFENNGLKDATVGNPSSGIFLDFVQTGRAKNRILNNHFSNNWNDVYCWEGKDNRIEGNVMAWDGARPTTKFSFLRVHDYTASPIVGHNDPNTTTAPYLFNDDSKKPRNAFAINVGVPWSYGTTAPLNTTDASVVGQVIFNSAPAAGGPLGWVCVTAGTGSAAVWQPFGKVGGNTSTTTPVTVTASPMSYTAAQPGFLYVIGGGWTTAGDGVTINAETVATTNPAGSFHVEKGDVVVFTYTSAPTAIKFQAVGSGGL